MNNKESIYVLVYMSNAKDNLRAQELYDIISKSASANRAHDVTGFLMFKTGKFIQVLEGEKTKIKTLYGNITRDDRHSDCRVIIEGFDTIRNFPDWSLHLNSFEKFPYFSKEEINNGSVLGVIDIIDKFDKMNY